MFAALALAYRPASPRLYKTCIVCMLQPLPRALALSFAVLLRIYSTRLYVCMCAYVYRGGTGETVHFKICVIFCF